MKPTPDGLPIFNEDPNNVPTYEMQSQIRPHEDFRTITPSSWETFRLAITPFFCRTEY